MPVAGVVVMSLLSSRFNPPRRPRAWYSVTGCGTDFLQWKWAEMD